MTRTTLRDTLSVDFDRYTEASLKTAINHLKGSMRGSFLPGPLALVLRAMEKAYQEKQNNKPVADKPDIRALLSNVGKDPE